jgi:predicted ArsR family transcriptional regulator
MPRPPGRVREALASALEQLHAQHGPLSARELAAAAQVGRNAAVIALKNMVRDGVVEIVDERGRDDGVRWHNRYKPASQNIGDTPQAWGGIEALADAMRGFVPKT